LASPRSLGTLGAATWLVVGYCALNTLIAYGAFAEALNHWEASRVSTVLALTPLGTLACGMLLALMLPGFPPPDDIDRVSIVGASMVVAGSMTTSMAGRSRGFRTR
jgi:drug/metabolite transporter (DMT)-like permease